MATETETPTRPEETVDEQIAHLRELFADAPEVGKKAFENVLKELSSQASQEPPPPVGSAGRAGARLGKVSELTIIIPLAPGGAERTRAFLRLLNGNLAGADKVGSVHDMRSCSWRTTRSCSSPPPTTATGTPTSTTSPRRFRTTWTSSTPPGTADPAFAVRARRTIWRNIRSRRKAGTSLIRI